MTKSDALRSAVAAWRAAPPDVRAPFLTRVAENAEAIASRDHTLGTPTREGARARMAALLGREGDYDTLHAALAEAIRSGALDADDPALRDHLRRTALDELAIDQPRYRHELQLPEG